MVLSVFFIYLICFNRKENCDQSLVACNTSLVLITVCYSLDGSFLTVLSVFLLHFFCYEVNSIIIVFFILKFDHFMCSGLLDETDSCQDHCHSAHHDTH